MCYAPSMSDTQLVLWHMCMQEWASQNGVLLPNRPDAAQQTTFRVDEQHSRNILQVRD